MKGEVVKRTKNLELPESAGVHYRLLCLTGKMKGVSFYLKGDRVTIGRGKSANIIIDDTKASREHAELKLVGTNYVVTDLGSQNGLMVNDLKVTQHTLDDNDKVIIGSTVFKFNKIEVGSLELVDDEAEDDEVDEDDDATVDSKKEGKKLIYGLVILGAIYLLLDVSEPPQTSSPKKKSKSSSKIEDPKDDFIQRIKRKEDQLNKEKKDKVTIHVHRGQREYREGNYFRAIEEFKMALIISPNSGQVQYYLDRTKQRLDEEINQHFRKAKREVEALRYSQAALSYCSIVRLLEQFPDDQRYKDAEENIRVVEEKQGLTEGEIKCFEGK